MRSITVPRRWRCRPGSNSAMTGWFSTPTEAQPIPSGRRARGRVRVPSSKSITHRYLNLALLARRPLIVERPLLAEDTRLFLSAPARCGWTVEERPQEMGLAPLAVGDSIGAPPAAGDSIAPAPLTEIFCGNAGTMLRFLVASLAALPGRWRLDGVARLRERPVGPLVEALRRLGAEVRYLGHPGHVPLEIAGGTLHGGVTGLDAGESSQFLSALLMAGLAAPRLLTVEVTSLTSVPYVEVTLAAVRRCGGRIEALPGEGSKLRYRVAPGLLPPPRLRVEGDASAACYPGAAVAWDGDEVVVRGGRLLAVDADLAAMPDQVPTLAALAPFARGTTRIRNVGHLRLKESDRLSAMASELRRLGAEVEEGADRLDIAGNWWQAAPPGNPVTVDAHGDHRIAMSLALVGLRRPGVVIESPQVVAKSYPAFWQAFLGLFG